MWETGRGCDDMSQTKTLKNPGNVDPVTDWWSAPPIPLPGGRHLWHAATCFKVWCIPHNEALFAAACQRPAATQPHKLTEQTPKGNMAADVV